MSERLLGFGKSIEGHERHAALILGLGKFRPQFERPFIKSQRARDVSFSMSILAALKQLHRIGFTVGGIICLGRRNLEARCDEQKSQSPKE